MGKTEYMGLWWDDYFLRGFGRFPTMNFYFLARWRAGEPRAADDAASAEWVPLARLGRAGTPAWPHMAKVFRELRRLSDR